MERRRDPKQTHNQPRLRRSNDTSPLLVEPATEGRQKTEGRRGVEQWARDAVLLSACDGPCRVGTGAGAQERLGVDSVSESKR